MKFLGMIEGVAKFLHIYFFIPDRDDQAAYGVTAEISDRAHLGHKLIHAEQHRNRNDRDTCTRKRGKRTRKYDKSRARDADGALARYHQDDENLYQMLDG